MPRAHRATTAFLFAFALAGSSGCGPDEPSRSLASFDPVPIEAQEDPVCGMLVRNQSAPRAQVRHRDGTSLAFCSLGDLLVHLSAPSRHGEVIDTYVEVMHPDEDPMESHTGTHPWAPAADVFFVVGVARRGIMGPPILSYRDAATATAVVQTQPGAQRLDFEGLRRWWRDRH
jgi:nitrous oxide reductase accessory protein NosL